MAFIWAIVFMLSVETIGKEIFANYAEPVLTKNGADALYDALFEMLPIGVYGLLFRRI